jgi:predicted nucleotidyltransferase/uncharacterized protein (UPF0332 family)
MEEKNEVIKEEVELIKKEVMTEKDIAMDFALQVVKKFDRLIKASVLFGSQTKDSATAESDIDIILIVDDASVNWDMELVAWYREELAKIISASRYAKDLHVNTIKLSTWWQDMIYGEPVVINIIRYGEALIDIGGFFNPLKSLLLQGKIRSTPEAVYSSLQRAPNHLARSKLSVLSAIEGVYWTMVDASQAVLMTAGKMPPSPEHIPLMLKTTFVDKGMMDIIEVKMMKDIYLLHKSINHGDVTTIKGTDIDMWQDKAEKYLQKVTSMIAKMIENR